MLRVIVVILLAVAIYAYRSSTTPAELPAAAPPGALAYLEAVDGDGSVTLFADRIVGEGFVVIGGGHALTIPLREITSVRRTLTELTIDSATASLTLDFSGPDINRAKQLEARINELRHGSG